MSSREIADLTGKNHADVMRDIRKLNESYDNLGLSRIAETFYVDTFNRNQPQFELTKMQTFDLMTGYNTELRIKVNRRWEELESKQLIDFTDPNTILQIAQSWKDEQDKRIQAERIIEQKEAQLQLQEHVIKESAPKVEYYDEVLDSKGLISTTIIAKDLGMSATTLNRRLNQLGVVFKQNNTWVPYAKYQSCGYCKSKTFPYTDHDGKQKTSIHFYWTEKGRKFIMNHIENRVTA